MIICQDMHKYKISQRLKNLLQARGIKKNELSKHLDVSPALISKWINGNDSASINMIYLYPLCSFLEVSIIWLLTGKNESDLSVDPYTTKEDWLVKSYRKFNPQLKLDVEGVVNSLHVGNNFTK